MDKTQSLIKQLNKASENLSPENKNIFSDIVIYIRTSNIKTKDGEEFLQQILDSFLNAEQQGVTIENVLGTTDIEHYCEEIVSTYKSSYNYLSRCSEYIMYTGMLITILSIINYTGQSLPMIIKYGVNGLTFYLNSNLGEILQTVLIVLVIIAIRIYINKKCFKKTGEVSSIKKIFKFFLLSILWIYISYACNIFFGKILLFELNIILVLIVGIILYFTGKYLSEK